MVRRWLLILSIRGALITGPLPHWWPLLHAGIITIAALSRLCHLSGTRPAVGAPAENSECARLTSDLAAAAVVLNLLPAAVALRALHVWPWHRTPLAPARGAAGGPAAPYVSDSQPPAFVLARRRGLRDPPPLRCMQDALDAHHSASIESMTDPGGLADHASASRRCCPACPSVHPLVSALFLLQACNVVKVLAHSLYPLGCPSVSCMHSVALTANACSHA